MDNKICKLLGIKYPIFQAGMVWVSGGKLAAAAANAGVLGIIGAGSMKPDLLKTHIVKARNLTKDGILAVNTPLLYHGIEDQLKIALDEGIRVFVTSAGSPKKYTKMLKDEGAKVIHVTSTPLLAKKCEDAGVDAVVAEGFEAGGHNGRDEITTMALIPQVVDAVSIPVIAAGGIADGRQVAAALALGAEAVQIGTRFAATQESSAHTNFKNAMIEAGSGATKLLMKKLVPVRLLENPFSHDVVSAEERNASKEELAEILGKGRAKAGMLDGDLEQGELEIGQVVSMIKDLPTCDELVRRILDEYKKSFTHLTSTLG